MFQVTLVPRGTDAVATDARSVFAILESGQGPQGSTDMVMCGGYADVAVLADIHGITAPPMASTTVHVPITLRLLWT